MAATEDRLRTLETQVDELSADLRVLRSLVEQDAASALNKIRYVTEKVLHKLCSEHGVSWGNGEPTVENMIGPLIAKKVIPKNVAIHVRTVQTNASPGSHFQETPLTATHVQVAQIALLDFLEWFYKVEAGAPAKPQRKPTWIWPALGALVAMGIGASIIMYVAEHRPPDEDPAPAPAATPEAPPKLRQPDVGLRAIATYREPKGAEISGLDSVPFWQNAARDFHDAAAQRGAPAEWSADARFCDAQALARDGKLDDAAAKFRESIELAPKSALGHAGLAIVLAAQGKLDDGAKEAAEAERDEPAWWGAVATEARVYTIGKKYDVAIQAYRRAIDAAPKQPVLLAELALVYHTRHLDTEAERYAKDALAIDADLVPAHILLAERALEAGKADTAIAEASRAVAVAPDSLTATMALADAHALAHHTQQALDTYKSAVELWHKLAQKVAFEDRMQAVEKAVAAGKLPPPRGGAAQRSPNTTSPPREPHRTGPCEPGNPLCGIE